MFSVSCDANKHFKVVSAGGDGFGIPYYFVGYDPILKSVIVSHQGTDIFKMYASLFWSPLILTNGPPHSVPVLTDITLLQAPLNPKLFPGLPHSINVHIGFREVQELYEPRLRSFHFRLTLCAEAHLSSSKAFKRLYPGLMRPKLLSLGILWVRIPSPCFNID